MTAKETKEVIIRATSNLKSHRDVYDPGVRGIVPMFMLDLLSFSLLLLILIRISFIA